MPTPAPRFLPRACPHRHAAALALAVVVPGLALDATAGFALQALIGVVAWIAALAMVAGAGTAELRTRMMACLALATAGELFLSLVWGLYDYRLDNVPFFVPPGHLLLMLAGMQLARAPLPGMFVHGTAAAVAAWAGYALWTGASTLDVFLAGLLLACLAAARRESDRRLYAVMLWLALALELYGTALGNWTWRPVEPWFGLTSANPPLAAGAFYSALDALALVVARAVHGERLRLPRLAWRRA
jgi:hypothetical protein